MVYNTVEGYSSIFSLVQMQGQSLKNFNCGRSLLTQVDLCGGHDTVVSLCVYIIAFGLIAKSLGVYLML